MRTDTKRFQISCILIVLALYLVFTIPQLQKPFVLDEVTNVQAAEAILQTGVPTHYEHELNTEQHSLWHPPLYLYLLSLFFSLFGSTEWSEKEAEQIQVKGRMP